MPNTGICSAQEHAQHTSTTQMKHWEKWSRLYIEGPVGMWLIIMPSRRAPLTVQPLKPVLAGSPSSLASFSLKPSTWRSLSYVSKQSRTDVHCNKSDPGVGAQGCRAAQTYIATVAMTMSRQTGLREDANNALSPRLELEGTMSGI
jgi:hypothetical protein